MKLLPERSCLPVVVETPRTSRASSFTIEICTNDRVEPDSSRELDRRSGHGDETLNTIDDQHAAEIKVIVDNGSAGQQLQWANAKRALQLVSRSSGYDRRSYRAGNTPRKEEERFSLKPVSSPRAIDQRRRSDLVKLHAVPFSGAHTLAKKSFCDKPSGVPSIIPVNFARRKLAGLNGDDPVSPDVTCLGRIKSKNLENIRAPKAICAESLMDRKVGCFDTKDQLCVMAFKGSKNTKRRLASAESKRASVEEGQTRRERAANLASSLSDILAELRRSEEISSYEPIVPPPNSLLLMRGLRKGDKEVDMDSGTNNEQPINQSADMSKECEPDKPPPNSLVLMRGCQARGNCSLPVELLNNGAVLKCHHEEVCTVPFSACEALHAKNRTTRAIRHLSLCDVMEEEEECATTKGVPTSELCDSTVKGRNGTVCSGHYIKKISEPRAVQLPQRRPTLYQRRSFAELSSIEVTWRTKIER